MRHNLLVADVMTNTGRVKAIGRHGISGAKTSVLARAAFEITSTHLLLAGLATGWGTTVMPFLAGPGSIGSGETYALALNGLPSGTLVYRDTSRRNCPSSAQLGQFEPSASSTKPQ